jgi:hydrogenase maturation protease
MIVGFDHLIIIDSIVSGRRPGKVLHLTFNNFKIDSKSFFSQHQVGILEAIELGRRLGMIKLSRIDIIAVEAKDISSFGEYLTPEVAAAVPIAVKKVQELLTPVLTQASKV